MSFGTCLSCRVTDEKAEIPAQMTGQHMALKLNDHLELIDAMVLSKSHYLIV